MKNLILLGALLLLPTTAQAWTQEARHALAKCAIAEVDTGSPTEQAVVLHVLLKRWELARARNPRYTLEQMARRYCSIFKVSATPRQRWIRGLDRHSRGDAWQAALELVARLEAGELPDPLPRALHWGSEEDHRRRVVSGLVRHVRRISAKVERIDGAGTVELRNVFYEVLRGKAKEAGRRQDLLERGRTL